MSSPQVAQAKHQRVGWKTAQWARVEARGACLSANAAARVAKQLDNRAVWIINSDPEQWISRRQRTCNH